MSVLQETPKPSQIELPWLIYVVSAMGASFGVVDALMHSVAISVALLALPPIIVVLSYFFPGAFQVQSRFGLRRVTGLFLAVPIGGMFFANLFEPQVNPWEPLVGAGVFAVVGFGASYAAVDPGQRWQGKALFALICAAYGYAATAVADIQFDKGPATIFTVPVLAKTTHWGTRHRASTYYLELPPWGPRTKGDEVEVPSSQYNNIEVGNTVRVALHPGTLKLPWYEVIGETPAPNPKPHTNSWS